MGSKFQLAVAAAREGGSQPGSPQTLWEFTCIATYLEDRWPDDWTYDDALALWRLSKSLRPVEGRK